MQRLIVWGLAAWVALTLLFTSPAPSLPDGAKPVKTETKFHVAPKPPRVDGEITVLDPAGASIGHWWLDRGRVYEPADGADNTNRGSLTLVKHRYLYDPGLDFGTIAAVGRGEFATLEVGVRASPARFLFGTLAPDLVIARDGAGVGLSAYLPADYFGRWYDHMGAGCWYLRPYDGSAPGFVFGLSFSTLP